RAHITSGAWVRGGRSIGWSGKTSQHQAAFSSSRRSQTPPPGSKISQSAARKEREGAMTPMRRRSSSIPCLTARLSSSVGVADAVKRGREGVHGWGGRHTHRWEVDKTGG
ncbi:unnamed protein product, partial [Discosporangium mesarthrocarpum]